MFHPDARFHFRIIDSFTGPFALMVRGDGAVRTGWVAHFDADWSEGGVFDESLEPGLVDRLQAYFAGDEVSFANAPLPAGGPFHRACWRACRAIPSGETISYGELARRAGSTPAAARAAGQAMRQNPMPIITPCHRVIGATGQLHGFVGTTDAASDPVVLKRALLEHERVAVAVGVTASAAG